MTERAGHPGLDTPGRPAIGAIAKVRLKREESRQLVAQVDGGSGHSGRRSPDIHFGLGSAPKDGPVEVELRWRDAAGKPQFTILNLAPGWHTILLGTAQSTQTAALNAHE